VEIKFHVVTDFLFDWEIEYSRSGVDFLIISEFIPHLLVCFLDIIEFLFVENRRRRISIGKVFASFLSFNIFFDDFEIAFIH